MEPWWKKHSIYKSDTLVETISANPDKFIVSRLDILQLILDFKTLKRRFIDLCTMQDAIDEWEALPNAEKEKLRDEAEKTKKAIEDIWNQ